MSALAVPERRHRRGAGCPIPRIAGTRGATWVRVSATDGGAQRSQARHIVPRGVLGSRRGCGSRIVGVVSSETEIGARWLDALVEQLPRHGRVVCELRDAVAADPRLRWFDVSCSLGAGRGDQYSDIDCGVGYAEPAPEDLEVIGRDLVGSVGDVADALVHVMDGFPSGTIRIAAEYADEVQLDLVLMPANLMAGLRDGEVAIVDKDGALAGAATSSVFGRPDDRVLREWALTGWWWVSDIAKYVTRGSLFEAVERIGLVRDHALKLFAAAAEIPYPVFGLTSLLDYEPFQLPDGLTETYPVPGDPHTVWQAATAVADLLHECSRRAETSLGCDLSTPWEATSRSRLAAALPSPDHR